MPNPNGPSAEARRTALLKRQRRAGTVLDGAAAKAASAKKAKLRGITPPSDVGRKGQPYYHAVQVPPLPPALTEQFEVCKAGTALTSEEEGKGTVPPMPPGAFVKEEEVPAAAAVKEEGAVPPMPPDAFVVKTEVVVKEEGSSGSRPKRQRRK